MLLLLKVPRRDRKD